MEINGHRSSTINLFSMIDTNRTKSKTEMDMKTTEHCCCRGRRCLGPMTFHTEVMGQQVYLSQGARRAQRTVDTFKHGLAFSGRPVRVKERVKLRVERCVESWHGALRVGFTNVAPGSDPVPPLAIPDLTSRPGYWVEVVPEETCFPGAELQFWVDSVGDLVILMANGLEERSATGLDRDRPIWALVDIYGQTCSVLLQGSKKKGKFGVKRSCPTPFIPATPENCGYVLLSKEKKQKPRPGPQGIMDDQHGTPTPGPHTQQTQEHSSKSSSRETIPLSMTDATGVLSEDECVICYGHPPSVTLACGHRCVCAPCCQRVSLEFGTCPLCRSEIGPMLTG